MNSLFFLFEQYVNFDLSLKMIGDKVETNEIRDFLSRIELFKDLNKNELSEISDLFEPVEYKAGQDIFRENTPRKSLLIIVKGKVELFKENSFGKEKTLRVFEDNDFLGEGALMDDHPHSTSARAITDTELIKMTRVKFNNFMKTDSEPVIKILSRISHVISRRMRVATSQAVGASAQYASGKTRMEHDLLGEREVPYENYYGIQTLRGVENFPITGIPISHFPALVNSLAQVKMACALANHDLGLMDETVKNAIVQSCQEVINGKYHIHFVVDMIQGGAGTSTNMNANEVIANRALELMGYDKGMYEHCHPNNHVNMSQSTNDVYPTAIKLAIVDENKEMITVLTELIESFQSKATEFKDVIKMGRTQLQDAVPMTLGQEFEAFAVTLEEEILRLQENAKLFHEINLGGTAIGTGINAEPEYAQKATAHLVEITGLQLVLAKNLIEATMDTGAFVMYSSAVKRLAVKLSKICNDLRLLSSGPRTGLSEINLPPMQPGSSIMPGKVNPVIPEVVNQIAFKVIGNDLTVTLAAEAGQLQLNVMEPVIIQSILESIEMLKNGMTTLKYRCIDGITANADITRDYVHSSIGLVTALVPIIGYDKSSNLAKEALNSGKRVYDLVLEQGLMTKEELDKALDPENMLKPHKLK